jgi:hypothetical protein
MEILRFDQTTFEDLHTYGLTNIINEICEFMGTEIDKGNVIVIERRYSNAQPNTIRSIRTSEELKQFKDNY